ncbi:hypothetical protein CS063_11940 [Sporanaerobium hydrogeniformans]|uniref:Uncharacterized protein n=1 Tax=Sporanaerobium hydrogeniformans TaxID=3072179 RepID=A0AC61DAU8_9FIRM|nr:NAD(P)/FAD-dependent oxidoreductase [Sporanaerobium hydrogeniformans]PHV70182.1 hypothetical protein CS063_11940 [Sporanaerobium hydrogeniformans]
MKKITIVGAGPAGLTAAYEILKRTPQYEVTILEQTDRIGGIACTVCHNGNYMDLGGHRFYSKCDSITKWWHAIPGVTLLKKERKSEIYYNKKFLDYPIKANLKSLRALGIKELVLIFVHYLKAQMIKKEENSLEDFYINRFGKRLYKLFFKNYTEKVWGIAPDKISPDWGSQRVKGLSIFEVIKDSLKSCLHLKDNSNTQTSLIEAFYYPSYGPGELWSAVAEEIIQMGGHIKKNCAVYKVQIEKKQITEVSYRWDGKEISEPTDILISSMPIKNLISGMENVPDAIRKLANGLVYRDFITVGMLIKNMPIKTDNCWIYMQDKSVQMGRVQIFNNWSSSLVKEPNETVWLGLEYFCNKEDALWNKSDKEIADFAADELIHTGMLSDKSAIIDTHIERIEKAYPAYFGTYKHMQEIRGFLDSFENLYCIGRNGQHRYNNMDHSMLTAFECVNHILDDVKCKDAIWKVNTEKEYN